MEHTTVASKFISIGEIMLRLDPGDGRIHCTREFKVWEGGGEYNVVRGLRRCFGLKQLEADIATLENNIGFFAGSKNAESLIAEVRIKITKAKEEMADAIKKVQAIDAADKQQD